MMNVIIATDFFCMEKPVDTNAVFRTGLVWKQAGESDAVAG
ncbi:hypothetical protein [Halopseudomonas xiamenensis]|nr:hypothetical protein [Halopseudomonas xiamenensis]